MIMAQSLFILLKEKYPAAQLDVLAPAWTFPLLQRMEQVNQALAMPLQHGQFALATRLTLGREFRSAGYDQAIVLPNSWKSALIPFFAQIPLRTGYLGEVRWGLLNDARRLNKQQLTMTVQRFAALAAPAITEVAPDFPFPRLTVSASAQQQVCEKFQLDRSQRILALCPGAEYGPAKCWPAEHYAAVAEQMLSEDWTVALFGSAKDAAIAAEINRMTAGRCQDLSGQTTLGEAVDLLSVATVVISNDSGLMHVAAALDKKVIALYGSSDPAFTPPLQRQAEVLHLQLDCAPCFQRICPLGHTRCLTELSPQSVLAKIA